MVLAAGQSRRFGADNKLMALIGGRPMVVGVIEQLATVRVPDCRFHLFAVTDPAASDVRAAIEGVAGSLGLQRIDNALAAHGIGTSIAAGVSGLPDGMDAAVITPGDLPLLEASLVERLIAAFIADGAVRPTHPLLADGTATSPVVWPRRLFGALAQLSGDRGGKSLLAGHPACRVPLEDVSCVADVDTPTDLDRVRTLSQKTKR